ncbi:MAG: T9SS type B sorting domain-containing protein, partial [Bacteroidota bacterium]
DNNINAQGSLNLYNMPIGPYTITFTDNCGFEYEKVVNVPPFVEQDFYIITLPSCEAGFGGLSYKSGNGKLTEAYITAAPAAFNQSLPYNVTSTINAEGTLYLADLPAGIYKVSATDFCGIVKEKEINVQGYMPSANPFTFTPNCGGFSAKVTDTSNGVEGVSYWLQKYFPDTNTWGHPGNGTAYTFDNVPTEANSIRLYNNNVRNNLNYVGKFRIIKKFETITTGTSQNTMCVSILGEFNYTDILKINTAYTLACVGSPDDVMLEVTGYPVSYKIVEKNGDNTFYLDNGANNVFTNLPPAEYVFRIEDACGNIVNQWFNVQTLPSLAEATQPDDMVICVEPHSGHTAEFNLTDQTDAVLGPLHSATYTVTYHLTYEDADNGTNALPEQYTNITNGQNIFVRVIHNEISLCHGITSFKIFVGEHQEPFIITSGTICNEGELVLTVNKVYDSYLWSTGETTRSIRVTDIGMYTVVVGKAYGTGFCDGSAEYEVKISNTPIIDKIEVTDWTDDDNTITVLTENEGDFEYSLDGLTYQDDNVFTGLGTGKFVVFVKDKNGCGQVIEEVILLNYPRFFTPNGDGNNDTWYIKYAAFEPHFNVRIMDRYGKILTTFGSTSRGWDGNLNGIQLPSTDYWFVVTREDGRELKGHFSMLR